nr:VP3 [Rotavirus A]
MKVVALPRLTENSFADTTVYWHDASKEPGENAFLLSNSTTHNVLYIKPHSETVDILNRNGISVVYAESDEMLQLLMKTNYTYDFDTDTIFLHDYSYYKNNEIRTEQWWAFETIKSSGVLPDGWSIKYIGYLGLLTKPDYNFNVDVYNTANDDDIIINFIYSDKTDFQAFLIDSIIDRCSTALQFDRLSNRIFREKVYKNTTCKINIGPRNESMFTLLKYPSIRNYAANIFQASNLIKLPQSRFAEKINSNFDIGQYKNMCNCISAIYRFYYLYTDSPKVYIAGSAPGLWIKDITSVSGLSFTTWDPLPTHTSEDHRLEYFTEETLSELKDYSVLYIDIRSERGNKSWIDWRSQVELETEINLRLAIQYLRDRVHSVVCVKLTAMNLRIPKSTILLHFPTTRTRSEFYALMDTEMNLNDLMFIPKGAIYAYINTVQTDNVFPTPAFNIRKSLTSSIALYALSNDINDKTRTIAAINASKSGLFTVRLNNTFNMEEYIGFKSSRDWLALPTDFMTEKTVITSYRGAAGYYGLSVTFDPKANGNLHLYIIKTPEEIQELDLVAGHFGISRHSHSIRFSEAATSLSGYFFRNLTNNVLDLKSADSDNVVSGHLYNAVIYYRYNYSFDVVRWLRTHAKNTTQIHSQKYVKHSFLEMQNAVTSAMQFAQRQNDITCVRYASQLSTYISGLWNIRYADTPNAYIAVEFYNFPSLIPDQFKDVHLTLGLLDISNQDLHTLSNTYENIRPVLLESRFTTNHTYMLGPFCVANVSGVHALYNTLFTYYYNNDVIFGQSRKYVPHVTLSKLYHQPIKYDEIELTPKRLYIKRIGHNETLVSVNL